MVLKEAITPNRELEQDYYTDPGEHLQEIHASYYYSISDSILVLRVLLEEKEPPTSTTIFFENVRDSVRAQFVKNTYRNLYFSLARGFCPLPLLLVGNLLTIMSHEPGYEAFAKWHKKFGPVYTYWIGPLPVVVVSDHKTMKDTFVKDGDAYVAKFQIEEVTKAYRDYRNRGEADKHFSPKLHPRWKLWRSGEQWRNVGEHRRFALHVLKDLGLNKNVMEEKVLMEVDAMTAQLMAKKGSQIEIQDVFDVCVGSVINQLLFGYRFDDEYLEEFHELKTMISRQMAEFARPSSTALFLFPRIAPHLPYFSGLWKRLFFYRDAFHAFFNRQIDAHEKAIDYESDQSSDYVEAYLKEKKRREAEGDYESFCHMQLLNMCFDLWLAGMETTSNTLSWGVAYLLNHPDVQVKVHEELDRAIGSGRQIRTADKNDLPYTCAVINEIQRTTNLLPLNLLHETTRDVQIGEFRLPEKTTVVAQLSTVLYDEEVFPDPYAFKPSRFIDDNGKLKKVDELIPFSIGKRQCLGEGLAKMELFLFIANLLNRFELSCVDPDEPPALTKKFGTTVQALPYNCLAKARYQET